MLNRDAASPRRVLPHVARIVMILLLVIGAMAALVADPASADPEHGMRNVSTQFCLTAEHATAHGIYAHYCYTTYPAWTSQAWHFHPGTYASRVMNYYREVCLDSNASGNVYGNYCTPDNAYQEWRITSNSFGYQLQNVATGRCLDSNTNREVYTLPCNGGNFQRWRIS